LKTGRGNTLLVELLVVILFFALSQTIVLQVFAKAQQINRESETIHHALTRARDVAETLVVSDDAQATLEELGFTQTDDGSLVAEGDGYSLSAMVTNLTQTTGTLTTVTLAATRDGVEIFSFPATHYKGGKTP
jgi:type II secretory pathway pseudopilin PulG